MKVIFKLLGFLLVTAIVTTGFLLWYQYDTFLDTPVAVTPATEVFEIKPGSNIRQVASQLEEKGIVQHGFLFLAHARITDVAHKLKAGEYKIDSGMKPDDLLAKFVSGQTLQYQLGIVEGKTFKDILNAIRAHPQIEQTLSEDDYRNLMPKLGQAAGMQAEGWFFPDTYNFPSKTTDLEFLQRSHKAMRDYLQKAWDRREQNPYIKTPYEALILASIVEKETGLPEERPLIARVFLNRLEKGMLLQTDPTVIYGMGDKYAGNIRKTDLQTDTPYNTYTRAGLPPSPIATPSKAAIDAVMHPAKSNVLYFVATTPGGASYFSATYEEHQLAVKRYILNAKQPVTPPQGAMQ